MIKNKRTNSTRRNIALPLALVFLAVTIVYSSFAFASTAQDSRPRRSNSAAPRATPTPVPRATPAPRTPAATPTPTPVQGPVDRIAPQLGEPPPAPILKPKPTPTPPEEFGEEDVVKVNTELVTLNVRVIDRNNRPIDNV